MQCLILAGGLGTRIKSVAGDTPKALLPVGPQTFIDWQLQWLKLLGVSHVIMAVGHGGEIIENHLKDKADKRYPKLTFSHDGPVLLGTGGAIKHASPLLEKNFIVAYGDSFLFLNIKDLFTTHLKSGRPLTFSIYRNKNKGDISNVIFKSGKIEKYDKFNIVPEMEYIDYGMSVINRDYFLAHTPEGRFDFATFITETCDQGLATPFLATEIFQEIGQPSGYQNFCKMMEGANFDLQALAHSQSLL